MQEYNYKFMAYPILNSLTQDTADKIERLIAYSEVMTRGKYPSPYPASAPKSSTTPRSFARLSGTTLRIYADILTMNMTSKATWVPS